MFSKAKIQRFNDIKVNKSSALPTVKAKTLPKSKGSNECSSEKTSEASSVKNAPCFKQPTMPLRRNHCLPSKSKSATNSTENLSEALKERTIECENKDFTIKELKGYIEELKEKSTNLEKQKETLAAEKTKYEEVLLCLNKEHVERVQMLTDTFEMEIMEAKNRENKIKEEIEEFKKEYEILKLESKNDISHLKHDLSKFEKLAEEVMQKYNTALEAKTVELKEKESELTQVREKCEELKKTYSEDISNMKREHQTEIQDIEYEMLKLVMDLEKERENTSSKVSEMEKRLIWELENMKNHYESEKQKILLETEEQMKMLREKHLDDESFKTALNEKLETVKLEWEEKLLNQRKEADEILKECQAISEYNIIQSEIEKNKIKEDLHAKSQELEKFQADYHHFLKKYDELRSNYRSLEIELSKIILELNDCRGNLGEKLNKKEEQISQLNKEKQAFEVTTKNLQTTIEVLTRRLIHSDMDVEQLKQELAECEDKLIKYEQKCLQLATDLKQTQKFNEELEMVYNSTIELNKQEINEIKSELCNKVDAYRLEAENVTKNLEKEKNLNKKIMEQLHSDIIDKMRTEIECFEALNSQYEFEIEQSQIELEDYYMREMDWNVIREKLDEHIKDMELKLELKEEELASLRSELNKFKEKETQKQEAMKSEQEEEQTIFKKYIQMSGKYDKLLQSFETLETKNLQKEKEILKLSHHLKENENIVEKYNLLKCEHENLLSSMKELENNTENNNLESKLNNQTKIIEKLKKENNDLKKYLKKFKYDVEDKENVASPNRSLNASRAESPFRERN